MWKNESTKQISKSEFIQNCYSHHFHHEWQTYKPFPYKEFCPKVSIIKLLDTQYQIRDVQYEIKAGKKMLSVFLLLFSWPYLTSVFRVQHVWISRHSFYRSTVLWFLKQAKQILNPHNSHPILQNVTFRFFRQRLHLPLVIFTCQCPVWTTPSRTLCWREENSPISAFTSSSWNSSWVNSPWARTPNLMIWYQKEGQRVAYIFKNYDSSSLFQCMITTSNE